MEPRHRVIAEIALRAAGPFGFALAGGYAVQAHCTVAGGQLVDGPLALG